MGKPWQCILCEATSAGTEVVRSKKCLSLCTWCVAELERTQQGFCRRCHVVAPISDFRPSSPRYCKACRREQAAPHREKNREAARRRRMENPAHRELERQRVREWRKKNPEKSRQAARKRYQQNREHWLAWQRAYHERNRERNLERLRADRKKRPEHYRLYRARRKLAILRGAFR